MYRKYPNRKLRYANAKFIEGSEGIIALCNLSENYRFIVNRKEYRVDHISEKSLRLESEGKKIYYKSNSDKFFIFVREVNGALLAWCHGVPCGDLIIALLRDPVVNELPDYFIHYKSAWILNEILLQ